MKKVVSLLLIVLLMSFSLQSASAYTNADIQLHSKYAYLYDRETSLVYLDKRSDERMFPASMTKILTVSLALEHIDDIHEVVTVTKTDFKGVVEEGATVAGFYPNEKVTYEDLLYGALLPSGADACQALARLLFGDVDKMVTAMNEKIKALELENTHFMNVTGLHDDNHYTTARDMAMILNHALLDQEFVKIFEASTYKSSQGNHEWTSPLQKAKSYKDTDVSLITGGKSGFTDEAGLTYASTMTIDHHQLILVTAKAEDRFKQNHIRDAATVSQYMNTNFHNMIIYKKDEEIDSIFVIKSFQGQYKIKAQQDISILVEKSKNIQDFDIDMSFEKIKSAPLNKDDALATIVVNNQSEPIYKYIITLPETIESSIGAIILHYTLIAGVPVLCLSILVYKIYKRKNSHKR